MGTKLVFVPTFLLVLLLAACSGRDAEPSTLAPLDSPTTAPSPGTTASAEPSASAVSTESGATAAIESPAGTDALLAAAASAIAGVHVSPLTLDACVAASIDNQPCFDFTTPQSDTSTGIASFDAGFPEGGRFTFLMGSDAAGQWQFWFGSEFPSYALVSLPGQIRACGGGADVPILDAPGGSQAGEALEGDILEADRFVLTAAGTFGVEGQRGEGFYHVTSPVEGWVDATNTSDASLGDCSLRDSFESTPRG